VAGGIMPSLEEKIVGGILLYLSCTISSAGGIGGGGLNVPIFLVVFGYTYQQAVVFSLCTVLGNYISQVYVNWRKRHPYDPRRPLIYWDAVLLLLPAQLGGSNIGVIIAKIFPEGVLIILAMVVLLFAGYKSFRKGRKYWLEESQRQIRPIPRGPLSTVYEESDEEEDAEDEGIDSDNGRERSREYLLLNSNDVTGGNSGSGGSYSAVHSSTNAPTTTNNNKEDELVPSSRLSEVSFRGSEVHGLQLPWPTLRVLGALWVLYACLYTILTVAVRVCSASYWSLLGASYVPLAGTVLWGLAYVTRKQVADPGSVLPGDINVAISPSGPLSAPLAAFVIGMLCTLLGIGGGELMGPLLLSLGSLPQVVSATTSSMSFLNTSSNIVHYAILGQIQPEFFAVFFSIGAVGGVCGRAFYAHVSKRYGRPSITIFVLLSVLFISVLLLIYHLATEDVNFSTLTPFC